MASCAGRRCRFWCACRASLPASKDGILCLLVPLLSHTTASSTDLRPSNNIPKQNQHDCKTNHCWRSQLNTMRFKGGRSTVTKELFPGISNASSDHSLPPKPRTSKDKDADLLTKVHEEKQPTLQKLRQRRIGLEQRGKAYVSECESDTALLAEAEQGITGLRSELRTSLEQTSKLEKDVLDVRAELKTCRAALQYKIEECNNRSAEYDRLKEQHTVELRQQHESNVKVNDQLNSSLRQVRADIDTAQAASLKEKARLEQVADVAQVAHQEKLNRMTEEYDRVAGARTYLADESSQMACRLIDAENETKKWQQDNLRYRA